MKKKKEKRLGTRFQAHGYFAIKAKHCKTLQNKKDKKDKKKTNCMSCFTSTPPSALLSGLMLARETARQKKPFPHRTRGRKMIIIISSRRAQKRKARPPPEKFHAIGLPALRISPSSLGQQYNEKKKIAHDSYVLMSQRPTFRNQSTSLAPACVPRLQGD